MDGNVKVSAADAKPRLLHAAVASMLSVASAFDFESLERLDRVRHSFSQGSHDVDGECDAEIPQRVFMVEEGLRREI